MSQHINIHPAPGMAALLPGWFVVPQNPISPVRYQQTMGELLPGTFVVPQNPLRKSLALGVNNSSMGCMSCQYQEHNLGMGSLGSLGFFTSLDPTTWGMAEYATLGVGAILILSMLRPGRSEYKSAVSSAKEQYRKAISSAKAKYPRVAGRVKRAYAAAADAL